MAGGFKINRQVIAKMMSEIQHEFDMHPNQVPVETSGPDLSGHFGATHIYNGDGPVIQIQGDNAQIAWKTDGAVQQGRPEPAARAWIQVDRAGGAQHARWPG